VFGLRHVGIFEDGQAAHIITENAILPIEQHRDTIYTFEQTENSITVTFNDDSVITFDHEKLIFGNQIVKDELFGQVKEFNINQETNRFTAEKKETGLWPSLFKDENNPEFVGMATLNKPACNLKDEMEDCDNQMSLNSAWIVYNFTQNQITHSANLGTTGYLASKNENNIVLKSDVDGLIWSLNTSDSENPTSTHEATLNAMSYVIAGKTNNQFKSISSNSRFIALCDRRHRAYIYNQSIETEIGNLRNRKTQKNVQEISTQQLITLPSDLANEDIVGLSLTNSRLFILTTSCLLAYHLF